MSYGRDAAADGAPVVFVLDEFEAFARSNKQTLLYNLLDLCQSSDTFMVVVGMTCRSDCIQLLEKRIQSRFDNRQLLFSHPDYNTLMKILSQRLLLGAPAGTVSDADSAVLDEMVTEWNKLPKAFLDANLQARRIHGTAPHAWLLRRLVPQGTPGGCLPSASNAAARQVAASQ